MPKAMVLLADGFEDIEAIAPIDILRRAGIEVDIVGVTGTIVRSGRGIRVNADKRFIDIDSFGNYDAVILPGGGEGYANLEKNERVKKLVEAFAKSGKIVAAICKSPLLLVKMGLLHDRKATIHPAYIKELDRPRDDKVVVDGNIITSQGPGTAVEFGLKIVEQLVGTHEAAKIRQGMVA